MKIDFDKIKLVIWDLDNTFWSGIISEMEIQPSSAKIDLIRTLTDCGIINSICSKNTFEICATKLEELEVFDFFVFPSIDWTPKGQRIKSMIKTMSLRPENVLFIDDDITNLGEASHYSPELMVAEPDIITDLIAYANAEPKKDSGHSRLQQYKILEKKNVEQQKFDNNEEFLYASNIKVVIFNNCTPETERIHELIQRSNQLNYTKKRISTDELIELFLNKEAQCGYVTVNDKFGEYGLVGFYAILNNRLEHFLFSCRTIGLGIEQYVYSVLNCPELEVSGAVVSQVEKKPIPLWINQPESVGNSQSENVLTDSKDTKILLKGPCDLSKSLTYIKNSDTFTYEFTYVNEKKGNIIEAHNHSAHILGLLNYSESQKQEILTDCIFVDEDMFAGSFFTSQNDVIFLSTLIEANYGIYKKNDSDIYVAFGSYMSPLTNPEFHEGYMNGTIYTANNNFTAEYLTDFSSKYEFIGKTTPERYIEILTKILANLQKKCTLCLILGVEFPCEKNMEYDLKERHISHRNLNNAIRKFAKDNTSIRIIDLNDIVKHQNDFTNNINHYTSRVYYEIAQKIIEVINEKTTISIQNYSAAYVYFDEFLNKMKAVFYSIFKKDKGLVFNTLYKIYKKINRKKR